MEEIMAAPATTNVVAGKPMASGGVLVDDLDTTLPTDATTALPVSAVALGYISEDGLTESGERTTEKIKAWGGDIVKVVQTEFSAMYTFTLIEAFSGDVLEAVFGASNVTTTPADASDGLRHAVAVNGDELPHKVFYFEVRDGVRRKRIVVPNGQITSVGERTYTDGGTVSYPVTVEAFEDSSGNNAYEYLDDGKPTA